MCWYCLHWDWISTTSDLSVSITDIKCLYTIYIHKQKLSEMITIAFALFFYASAFRRQRHYVFGLSVRPSEAWNTLFRPVYGSIVHPTNRNSFAACLPVRPERFPGICRRTHRGNGLKFYMLMYLDHLQNWILALFWFNETGQIWAFRAFPGEHMEGMAWNFCMLMYLEHLQNWLVYGHGLLIFLILALFWHSEMGQIWGFRAFPGACMEGMAWNLTCWCILTTFRTD